jgi:hypothetical protein
MVVIRARYLLGSCINFQIRKMGFGVGVIFPLGGLIIFIHQMVDLLLSPQSQIIVSAPPTIEMVGYFSIGFDFLFIRIGCGYSH